MRIVVSIGLLALLSVPLPAGTLRLGPPVVRNNQYTFPVYLQGNANGVAALDFRLAYDPAVFSPVSASSGASAVQAQKQISSNVAEPGEFVVVMMGFNQNSVRPGEVVALVMEKIGEPADGQSTLRINEPTMATIEGVEIDSNGLARTVRFDKLKDQEEDPGADAEKPGEDGGKDTQETDPATDPADPATPRRVGLPFIVAERENGLAAAPGTGRESRKPGAATPIGTAALQVGKVLPGSSTPGLEQSLAGGIGTGPGEARQTGTGAGTLDAPAALPLIAAPGVALAGAGDGVNAVVSAENTAPESGSNSSGNPGMLFGILLLLAVAIPLAVLVAFKVYLRSNS